MYFKIKIRPADKLFSQVIRKRDKMQCQYNFKCFRGTPGNQVSHFQKRRHESVRFDLLNGDWCCPKCHYFIENDPEGQKTLEVWKKKQLGEQEYNKLILRRYSYKKKDDVIEILKLKEMLKSLA